MQTRKAILPCRSKVDSTNCPFRHETWNSQISGSDLLDALGGRAKAIRLAGL
jgi:hypothetical protein